MKFIHLSDLHLGKRVNGFSMIEDQKHILRQILDVIDAEQPDAALLAGDIYDKPVPTAEAVRLFDDFLVSLNRRGLRVLMISGNHDSPERIAFGARLMRPEQIYVSPVYDGTVDPVVFEDAWGPISFWLLPFIKPANVRAALRDDTIATYTDALQAAVGRMEIDPAQRNVLVAHQFVTGAAVSGSEELSVGGLENVDASVFDAFDYVALGHIHSPQRVSRDTLRYAGSPLKYSLSEKDQRKSVTLVELREKGAADIHTVPLRPLHDLRELRGTYQELTLRDNYIHTAKDDYLHVVLTDEEDVPDALARLRIIYPNLMKLDYDNQRTRSSAAPQDWERPKPLSPIELFSELYTLQNGQPLSETQLKYVADVFEALRKEEDA